MLFNGKTAIVTGGAQGIGKSIVLELLKAGYGVVAADSDSGAGAELLEETGSPRELIFLHTDVGSEPSVRTCVGNVVSFFGRLDAVINNAGISCNKPLMDLSLDEWRMVLDTNLTGAFLMTRYAAPHLERTRGSIVNIASTRALQSEANTEAYSASKGGLVALTHAMAISFSHKIRVNCISPGWIEVGDWKKSEHRTEPVHSEADKLQHPAGRVGRPEDISSLVRYLLSDEAGFITGQNFVVDGGMTKKMIYA